MKQKLFRTIADLRGSEFELKEPDQSINELRIPEEWYPLSE